MAKGTTNAQGGDDWISLTNLNDIEIDKLKIGSKLLIKRMQYDNHIIRAVFAECYCVEVYNAIDVSAEFAATGYFYDNSNDIIGPLAQINMRNVDTSDTSAPLYFTYVYINSNDTSQGTFLSNYNISISDLYISY